GPLAVELDRLDLLASSQQCGDILLDRPVDRGTCRGGGLTALDGLDSVLGLHERGPGLLAVELDRLDLLALVQERTHPGLQIVVDGHARALASVNSAQPFRQQRRTRGLSWSPLMPSTDPSPVAMTGHGPPSTAPSNRAILPPSPAAHPAAGPAKPTVSKP